MNKEIKKRFPRISKILHSCRERYYLFLGKYYPKKLIKVWYKLVYNRNINLVNPRTLDEKINWMKLHSDLSLWVRCADKYTVRQYVEEHGLGHLLNKIYGVYEKVDDIDFDAFPQSFVLKTTNGGGGKNVLIVKNKNNLDLDKTKEQLSEWLKQDVGYRYYEPHYTKIKPRIIAEKFLKPNNNDVSLVDYKFNCFDGRVYSVFLCSDRVFNNSVHYSVYDLDWNILPQNITSKYRTDKVYPKPASFNKMIEYSRILSKGIPYVRIDWYEIDNEPVFSEMTFTPGGAFQHFYSDDYLNELGDQLHLE